MPEYPQSGFLPACPADRAKTPEQRGNMSARKPRAQDMDESLMLTQQMKEHIEGLTARQSEALKKMKDSKSAVSKLRDQVSTLQQQMDAVQSETKTSGKATSDLRSETEKLENEHAVLHATHTWTKSSLDSALAAQEEYRKGYNSLRSAFKKAKEDLERANEELKNSKSAHEELQKSRAILDEKKAQWDKELDSVNATMQRIARKHKDKAKAVLDRMQSGQASSLLGTCFANWLVYLKDWKNSEKAKAEVEAAKAKLAGFQSKKNEEAKQFLNRMSAASDSGLVAVAFKAWLSAAADALKEQREADKMSSTLKNQKLEARKKLEATLGENMKGLTGLVLKNWAQMFKEEKEERELKAQADAVMKDYQKRKRGEAMGVVGRMAQKKENALLGQIVLVWKIFTTSEVAAKFREAEAKKRLETIGTDMEAVKKAIALKKGELREAHEELSAVQTKNKAMREQLEHIMALEDSMEQIQSELEKDD